MSIEYSQRGTGPRARWIAGPILSVLFLLPANHRSATLAAGSGESPRADSRVDASSCAPEGCNPSGVAVRALAVAATARGGAGTWLSKLFDTSDYPQRWNCGNWTPFDGWLHIVADASLWAAYTCIPLILAFHAWRKRDVTVRPVVWLFAVFFLSSGIGHLLEAASFWWPAYRLLGLAKVITVILSWMTIAALVPMVPKALALAGLAKANEHLSTELTARKDVEAALREAQKRLESQTHALDEHAIVAITNSSGRITYVNQKFCDISQYSADELLGQDHRLVNSGYHSKQFFVDMWRTIARGETWHGEMCNRAKDGSTYWVDTTIVPLRGGAGKIIEYAAIRTDITRRKQVESTLLEYAARMERTNAELAAAKGAIEKVAGELEQSNRELDDFAYIASHDLKEPLRGIHNYATHILEDYGDKLDDNARRQLETLPRLCVRLDGFIDSLLHFSQVGRTELAIASTDLNDVVADVVDSLGGSLKEHNVEVRIAPLPTVPCDRMRVSEVFQNLIGNAMKYNDKPEKWIEVGTADSFDEANGQTHAVAGPVFFVRDNGIGIPERHLNSVFRIFKRLHARDKFGGGTGAGLTIVRKIVARHGGRIWVESAPGVGTTFYFTLKEKPRNGRNVPCESAAGTVS